MKFETSGYPFNTTHRAEGVPNQKVFVRNTVVQVGEVQRFAFPFVEYTFTPNETGKAMGLVVMSGTRLRKVLHAMDTATIGRG